MSGRAATTNVRPGDYALSIGLPDKQPPAGWVWVALSEVARMATGHTPSRYHPEYWTDGEIPWVTATDANPADGGVILETREKINQLGLDNSAAVLLPEGTVCLSRTGASIGYTVILGRPMATSQGFVNWVCSDALSNKYLLHLLMAERRALFTFGEGSAHATIYFPEAKAFHICLPPRKEQDRIVANIDILFSMLDAGVAALKRVKAKLKRYRAAVLKAAVEGKLTAEWRKQHPDVEPASKLLERILQERRRKWEESQLAKFAAAGREPPKGWREKYQEPAEPETCALPALAEAWCWASVEQCASSAKFAITDGPFGSNLKTAHYTEYGPLVIRLQNIGDGVFVREDAHISPERFSLLERHSVKAGDIVTAMLGERLPRACLIPLDIPPAIVKADCVKIAVNSMLVPQYLLAVLNAHPTRQRASTKIAGVGRPRLNLEKLRPMAVPLPPHTEQRQIVAEIERRLSIVDELEAEVEADLKRAGRLRQSILKRAFEGRLVPQDPADEPAEKLLERISATAAKETSARRPLVQARRSKMRDWRSDE